MTIRVLVADDQAMIRGALAGLLDLESDIEVVAQAADGAQPRVLGDAENGRAHARRGSVPGPRRRLAVDRVREWYQSDTMSIWL